MYYPIYPIILPLDIYLLICVYLLYTYLPPKTFPCKGCQDLWITTFTIKNLIKYDQPTTYMWIHGIKWNNLFLILCRVIVVYETANGLEPWSYEFNPEL